MFGTLRRWLFGKDRRRELRERLELRAMEAQLQWYDALIDPREPLYDDADFWQPAGAGGPVPVSYDNRGTGEAVPVYLTEYELKVIRDRARRLAATNEFAINGAENRISYIVGKGYSYKAVHTDSPPEQAAQHPLARRVQAVVDDFIARTAWGEREQELKRRCDRDGEAFLRLFHGTAGRTDVRFVEPELVRDTEGRRETTFGVITDPDDVEDVQAYSVIEDPSNPRPTVVDAAEIIHVKLNTDSTAKRGLPTFYPVRKNLERAEKLLRNMSVLAAVQSTYAVVRKHKQFSASAVSTFRQAQADAQLSHPFAPGKSWYAQAQMPGQIIDTGEDTDYEFPAARVDASSLVAILQAELRAVAARLVMPEWMLTVDASNANYSSSMVAEAPSTKNFERFQAFYGRRFGDGRYSRGHFCGAVWRAIAYAVDAGRLPREALTEIEIQAEAPSLTARDKDKETGRAERLNKAGVLSKQTWSQWEGLDREQERRHLAREGQGSGPGPGDQGDNPPAAGPGDDGDPFGLGSFDVGEGCVPNQSGPGHHDEDTGHPCAPPGAEAGKKKPPTKVEKPAGGGDNGHPGAAHGAAVRVSPVKGRVFGGKPVATQSTLTKQETGRVGEAVVVAYLKHLGHADAGPMNSGRTNFPIDLIEDHRPTEVKAGLVSNSASAQQWRLTFSKETAAEKALYEKMTPAEREQWNAEKQQRIHERKRAAIKALEEESGEKIKPRTMTVVINPDTQTADIYSFDGFHDRIGWTSDLGKKGYVATVRYDHPEGKQ